jgi:putative transcriptional regulator
MTTEQREELASLYVAGAMTTGEKIAFETQLSNDPALRELVRSLERATDLLAIGAPQIQPPPTLKDKVLCRIDNANVQASPSVPSPSAAEDAIAGIQGFVFHGANDPQGWKPLPLPGAWIKLLSFQPDRNIAILLGKLGPGVRYPAHTHMGPEELLILSGDLHIGALALGPGDFHHSDAGTHHEDNHSIAGCVLLAVLPANHELVQAAMA